MIGIVLALLSAMAFGFSQVLVRRKLDESNFFFISLAITIMGNIILWPIALILTNLRTINFEGVLFFVVAGLLAPAIVRLIYFKGMEAVGVSANASVFATYPMYSSLLAVLILGEVLVAENWIGIICVIVGIVYMERNLSNSETRSKKTPRKGFVFPLIASLTFAFSQIVRKQGLNIYNEPLLGVAIGYSSALLLYILLLVFSNPAGGSKFSGEDLRLFWKPGLGISLAWLLSFLALSQESVSIIAPLLQTELLFVLFFGYIFLRKIEDITFKLIISALLIVTGVILVSIS
jgi:drug/metabolite transporter (DMT)-like permease